MHSLLQNIRNGRLEVSDVPAPLVRPGEVLIANRASVISAGTERSAVELSRKSLLGKARERPDHTRRVLEKVRTEGLLTTWRQVQTKLNEPMPLGYSAAGVVLACGEGIQEYKPGDRVASNGPHADVVSVPRNLCARVPDNVAVEQAAFTVLGAIAMQGVRLSRASLGERVFVIGLGLVGQLTVSLLAAAGCRVFGTDLDASKCELAETMGAETAEPGLCGSDIECWTGGLGADAVLITASTKSNEPVQLAGYAVRKKGRVVLVGVVGLELDRRPFYFKEAEFVVSCSYGPGRYDPDYEQRGDDYPPAYVRWTEQRNMQAVLDLMASGKLDVAPLISHRFPIEQAADAYSLIEEDREASLGILLEYPETEERLNRRISLRAPSTNGKPRAHNGKVNIGVLGAGSFARQVLLPAIRGNPLLQPTLLCSAGGVSATHVGRKFGFGEATSDEEAVFANENVRAIFSITRHDLHGRHVLRAIEARKPLFVEKPLCLSIVELGKIEAALSEAGEETPLIMVGFNRRFSPATKLVTEFFHNVHEPLTVSVRFNADSLPPDHWTQNEKLGGGRIIGEACHGIDLATFLCGAPPVRVFAESVGGGDGGSPDDRCYITLRHADGSVSNIAYLAGGDKAFPKERVEVFGGGRVAVIDDFRRVTTCANGRTKTKKFRRQDKGHRAEIRAFATAVQQGGPAPIPWENLRSVSVASILAVRSLREATPLPLSSTEEMATAENVNYREFT